MPTKETFKSRGGIHTKSSDMGGGVNGQSGVH